MKKPDLLSRRSFIRRAATTTCLAAVAPQIVPSSVLGADGHTAPSNRITVGFMVRAVMAWAGTCRLTFDTRMPR